MEVVFADAEMQMDSVCVVDNETVIFDARVRTAWTSGSRIYPWRFLNEDAKNDCGWYLTISQKARRFYVDIHNPQKVAEPVVLTLFASLTAHWLGGDELPDAASKAAHRVLHAMRLTRAAACAELLLPDTVPEASPDTVSVHALSI